jgi:hypothetical protein
MPDVRDPMALLCHAAQVGDWLLLDAVARVLGSRQRPRLVADRAYESLVVLLGLANGS